MIIGSRPSLPASVVIRDVGPRDGLQPEAPVDVAERIALVEALCNAGLRRIEAVAFVSPKAVPAMAGAAEVMAGVNRRNGLHLAALVPNLTGAEMALESGVDEITVTVSFSPEYNQRNVRMTIEESERAISEVTQRASSSSVPVDAVISCAFGSPYEGDADPNDVIEMARRLGDGGVESITFADTTGMATPRRVHDLLDALARLSPDNRWVDDVGLHLHDTRGTALANALAGLERGITRFDTAVGGLGGSPFAQGAGGNLATESLVSTLDDMDVETGIDLDALVAAARMIERLVGHAVPSGVARHGSRLGSTP